MVLNSITKNSTCGVSLGHWCYFFLVIIIKITLTFNCSPVVFSGSSTIFCLGHNHHNHFHFLIALLQIQSKSVNLIFSRWELCKDTVVIIHILVMDQTLGNVMVPMKGHTTKNKERSATNVTLYLLGQAVWGNIWKHTLEKNQTNATSVTLHHLEKAIWVSIWKRIVEKRHTIATSVTTHPLG